MMPLAHGHIPVYGPRGAPKQVRFYKLVLFFNQSPNEVRVQLFENPTKGPRDLFR